MLKYLLFEHNGMHDSSTSRGDTRHSDTPPLAFSQAQRTRYGLNPIEIGFHMNMVLSVEK